MKTDKNIAEETIKIPMDMMMDILAIVVKEELKHEIVNIIPNRNMVILELTYERSNQRAEKAIKNIQTLLADYQHYRSWEHEEVNWKED
jgi:hypothetical protein